MTSPLLELDHVTKRFGRVVIAEDLSFSVSAGRNVTRLDSAARCRPGLVEVAELREGGDVAVRGIAGEVEPLRKFADSERRAVPGKRAEDHQATFE
jgi:hypothetical protein